MNTFETFRNLERLPNVFPFSKTTANRSEARKVAGKIELHREELTRQSEKTLGKRYKHIEIQYPLPGMSTTQNCARNVNLIDLYLTLIDLCGLSEKELDGKSIKPLI